MNEECAPTPECATAKPKRRRVAFWFGARLLAGLLLLSGCYVWLKSSQYRNRVEPLRLALREANRMEIREGYSRRFTGQRPGEETVTPEDVVGTLLGAEGVAEWLSLLAIRWNSGAMGATVCGCAGAPWLVFFHDDLPLARISVHHGENLYWHDGAWNGNAELTPASARKLRAWLERHGVPVDETTGN